MSMQRYTLFAKKANERCLLRAPMHHAVVVLTQQHGAKRNRLHSPRARTRTRAPYTFVFFASTASTTTHKPIIFKRLKPHILLHYLHVASTKLHIASTKGWKSCGGRVEERR